MTSPFLTAFSPTSRVDNHADPELLAKVEAHAAGFADFMTAHGGTTFDQGLYRVHAAQDIVRWTANVEVAFPGFAQRLVCFGYDWLGRHFALDQQRLHNDQLLVLLLEPGTGEALEVPVTFGAFHDEELVGYRNDALASEFHGQWLASGGAQPEHHQCVGYTVPLFLGGSDEVSNLELSDLDVYWSICGQTLSSIIAGAQASD